MESNLKSPQSEVAKSLNPTPINIEQTIAQGGADYLQAIDLKTKFVMRDNAAGWELIRKINGLNVMQKYN